MAGRVFAAAAVVLLAALAAGQAVYAAESFSEAFTKGEFGLSLRYRFEYVDQESFVRDAEASTLRGRVNFATDPWNGFSAFAEFDYVTDIIWDDYNAGAGNTPNKVQYPVVADPTGPDLNQAYLDWTGTSGTQLRGGRQRIIYDNARFVGAVGWRQNEQTFDGAYFNRAFGHFNLQLAYIWQVDRIFGRDVPAGQDDHATTTINLSREWEGQGKLSFYFYDIDNKDDGLLSNRSVGLRWAGDTSWSGKAVTYTLEYAHQNDTHDQPLVYTANYFRADLGVTLGKLTPGIGYESLGAGDAGSGAAFQTPLATLHGFNGWADKFLTTPVDGVVDRFIGLKGPIGKWTWNVVYHDFDAESGGASYGSEIDGSISRDFGERYGLLFKAARFEGDGGPPYDDVSKLWLQFTADF
jgi:hypothetical protein